jgi:Predicted integral membrane protein (DUF2269)
MACVTLPAFPAAVHSVPKGAVYSILLLLHVACAVVGFGALAMTGVQARRARRGPTGAGSEGVRRFFRPGVNWAARTLYAVPVFGFALISSSAGAFSTQDGFVIAGLALWALATVVAEVVVWPGERRIQMVVSAGWDTAGQTGAEPAPDTDGRFAADCRRVALACGLLSGIFIAAVILMVAQP